MPLFVSVNDFAALVVADLLGRERPFVTAVRVASGATDTSPSVNRRFSMPRSVSVPSVRRAVGHRDAAVGVLGDRVVRPRAGEHGRVDRAGRGGLGDDLALDDQVARVDEAGEDGLAEGHVGRAGTEVAGQGLALHEVGRADLGAGCRVVRTLMRTCSALSPSMMSFPPRPSMVSPPPPPSRMLPSPQTLPESGHTPGLRHRCHGGGGDDAVHAGRREARDELGEPGDPVEAGLVERVAAGEPGSADRGRRWSSPLMRSLNVDPESASVSCQRSRLTMTGSGSPASWLLISMSSSAPDGVVLVERPVEPAGAGVAVDGRVLRHEVVAALGVVVVLADLTDEDVVAGCVLAGVVEERRAVVALEQVLAGPALDPVVTAVAEHGVCALAGDDEVVPRTGERLVVVRAAVDEVAAVAAHEDVVARAAVDGVVAVAALEDVGAVEVGDDVVAVTADGVVVAAVALEDVVARRCPRACRCRCRRRRGRRRRVPL